MTLLSSKKKEYSMPELPPDLSVSNAALDSYLSTLKESNYIETRRVRQVNRRKQSMALKALEATKEIKVTPIGNRNNKVTTYKPSSVSQTLQESNKVTETRTGYKVSCTNLNCLYTWITHTRPDKFYCNCPRCHKRFRIFWK